MDKFVYFGVAKLYCCEHRVDVLKGVRAFCHPREGYYASVMWNDTALACHLLLHCTFPIAILALLGVLLLWSTDGGSYWTISVLGSMASTRHFITK